MDRDDDQMVRMQPNIVQSKLEDIASCISFVCPLIEAKAETKGVLVADDEACLLVPSSVEVKYNIAVSRRKDIESILSVSWSERSLIHPSS